jgi:hypothetical protein
MSKHRKHNRKDKNRKQGEKKDTKIRPKSLKRH